MDGSREELCSYLLQDVYRAMAKQDVVKRIGKPYTSLTALATSRCFRTEVFALKKITLRVAVRLRNGKLPRLLRMNCKYLFDLANNNQLSHFDFVQPLISAPDQTGSVYLPNADEFVKTLQSILRIAEQLEKVVNHTLYTFGEIMPMLRLGHLANHLLILVSTLSRLNVTAKALLVHTCDFYKGLAFLKEKLLPKSSKSLRQDIPLSIDTILEKCGLIPEVPHKKEARAPNSSKRALPPDVVEEDLGVVIARNPQTIKKSVIPKPGGSSAKKRKRMKKK